MATTQHSMTAEARALVAHEVLVVDRDEQVRKGLVQLVAPEGLAVTTAEDPARAVDLLKTKFFGVVVVDLDTPSPNAGVELVKAIHELSPASLVLVVSPRRSFEAAVTAFRSGADDVIVKAPDQVAYLKERIVAAAAEVSARGRVGALLQRVLETFEQFLKKLMEAERVAQDLEDKARGRDTSRGDIDEDMRALVVDSDPRLYQALSKPGTAGRFTFTHVNTGGEALDRITTYGFHLALVGHQIPDFPPEMVVSALKAQSHDLLIISYTPNGKLELVEGQRRITLADRFDSLEKLTGRLDEIAMAHQAKARERRYLQAFREKHYEFLRQIAELKKRLEAAMAEER